MQPRRERVWVEEACAGGGMGMMLEEESKQSSEHTRELNGRSEGAGRSAQWPDKGSGGHAARLPGR